MRSNWPAFTPVRKASHSPASNTKTIQGIGLIPRSGVHAKWLTAFRLSLRDEFRDGGADANDTGDAGGRQSARPLRRVRSRERRRGDHERAGTGGRARAAAFVAA